MSRIRSARPGRLARVSALVAVAVFLTGCQTAGGNADSDASQSVQLPPLSSLTPAEDPSSIEGPTTVVVGGPTMPPVARETPQQALPVTVNSRDRDGDTPVEVTDTSRLLALSLTGTLADFVHAYGLTDQLVGKDVATTAPGTEDLQVVTKAGHSIDAEGVLSLSPTLILTDGSIGPLDVVMQLRDAGIPVVTVDRVTDFESTYDSARDVARALGVPELGDQLVDELQTRIAEKEAEIQDLLPADQDKLPRVAFLYLRGAAGIYYLFGEGSGIDTMIDAVGAIDVAKEVGWKGERPMTDEALIAIDPDVIIVMTKGLESVGGVDGMLEQLPSVALTQAGERRRIVDVSDTLLLAGGTRIPDVLDGLARALYAPDSLQGLGLN